MRAGVPKTLDAKRASLPVQFVFLVASRGLGSAVQAVLIIIFARLAGVEGMGIVAVVTAVMSMLFAVSEFGMSPLLAKSRAQGDNAKVKAILRANLLSSLGFAILGFAGLFLYLAWDSLPLVVAVIALSMGLEKNTDVSLNVPIADGRKWVPAFSIILRRCTNLSVFAAMLLLDMNPLNAYVLALLVGAVAGQAHIFAFRRNVGAGMQPASLRSVIKQAVPYSVSNISVQSKNLDSALVGWISGLGAAGLYSAALKLTNPFTLVAGSLGSVIMPHAVRNGQLYAAKLSKVLVGVCLGALILVSPFAWFSVSIVPFVLGDDFASAAGAFAGCMYAIPFLSLASPLGSILQSQNQVKFVAWNGVIFACVSLLFISVGAMLWGSTGAAYGLAVSYAAKCVSLCFRIAGLRRPERF